MNDDVRTRYEAKMNALRAKRTNAVKHIQEKVDKDPEFKQMKIFQELLSSTNLPEKQRIVQEILANPELMAKLSAVQPGLMSELKTKLPQVKKRRNRKKKKPKPQPEPAQPPEPKPEERPGFKIDAQQKEFGDLLDDISDEDTPPAITPQIPDILPPAIQPPENRPIFHVDITAGFDNILDADEYEDDL